MRKSIALVFVLGSLAAAGCKKKGGDAASPCDAAVTRGVDQTIAKRRASTTQPMTPEEAEVPKKLKAALARTCVDDKWSAEVIDCFKSADDIATCKEKLTPEQRSAYTRAAMSVMMQGRGGMPPHGMRPQRPPNVDDGSAAPPADQGGAAPTTNEGSAAPSSDSPAGSATN